MNLLKQEKDCPPGQKIPPHNYPKVDLLTINS